MAIDMSKVRARRMELQKASEDRKKNDAILDLREGPNKIRILPPWSPEGAWEKRAKYHYNITKGPIACSKEILNQPCAACEFVEQLYKSGDEEEKKVAYKFKAKDRFFANVVSLDKNDGKVYILPFGITVEEQIIKLMDPGDAEKEFAKGDITDPNTGYNLIIDKDVPKDKMQTSYKLICANSPTPLPNWETYKTKLHDLDALVAKDLKPYADVKAALEGGVRSDNPPPPPVADVGDGFESPRAQTATATPKPSVDEFGQPLAQQEKKKELRSALDQLKALKKSS